MPREHEFILTLSCRDTTGIVHAVSGLLYQGGCNIIDSQQFGDLQGDDATGLFFMRVHFAAPPHLASRAALQTLFEHAKQQFGMDLQLVPAAQRARVLLLVSRHGHCLNDLLFRWRSGLGDRAAFAQLYERSSSHLFAVVLRIQRDRALAEELLQEIYVAVWKAASGFDAARSQPLTWMTSIARNRAIDSLRRAQAQPRLSSSTPDDDEAVDEGPRDDGPGPLDLLQRASDARELSRCMQDLSPPQRQSVALAFFDGLSHAEVAERLHEPLGTVKSWVRRALSALKGCLERAVLGDDPRGGKAGA